MSWTTPVTWTAGQLVSQVDLNAQIRDNENVLKTSINNDGTLHGCARRLDSLGTESDVTNTNVETTLYSYTVPGGLLPNNGMIRLTVTGLMHVDTTNDTLTLRVKYGASQIASWQFAMTAQTDGVFVLQLILSANNASNSQRAALTLARPANNTTSGNAIIGPGNGVVDVGYNNTLAVDSTVNENLVVTAQWTGTLATDHCKIFSATTELVYA